MLMGTWGHVLQGHRAGSWWLGGGWGGWHLTLSRKDLIQRPASPPVLPFCSWTMWLILSCPQGLGDIPRVGAGRPVNS